MLPPFLWLMEEASMPRRQLQQSTFNMKGGRTIARTFWSSHLKLSSRKKERESEKNPFG